METLEGQAAKEIIIVSGGILNGWYDQHPPTDLKHLAVDLKEVAVKYYRGLFIQSIASSRSVIDAFREK